MAISLMQHLTVVPTVLASYWWDQRWASLISCITYHVYSRMHLTNVTGFWKTDQIVILGLFHFIGQLMATLVHYTYTVPLPGLANWSAFLERVL